jgi:hypothetical protein
MFFPVKLTENIFLEMMQMVQLVAKKSGNENFPNVNLILSVCQLIVYLAIPIK